MSRVGKKPITVPEKVKVSISGQNLSVEGPKGKLQLTIHPRIKVQTAQGKVTVERPTNQKQDRALHGLTRSLVNNLIVGVTDGFSKTLEIEGVGFRAQVKGKSLNMTLGFSHPIDFIIPEGIEIKTPQPTAVIITGINKQQVGQVAADIRHFYEPEPYGGKGIRYKGEVVRRKQGKTVG
jgi:large subunit ribosomal protein L6